MRKILIGMGVCGLTAFSGPAWASWHTGRVVDLAFAYDGSTITFALSGWSRTNCTCYDPWPTYMCLDRARVSFKEEYAWLLLARTIDKTISVSIDEASCKVLAMEETD